MFRSNVAILAVLVWLLSTASLLSASCATDEPGIQAADELKPWIVLIPKIVAMTWQEGERATSRFSDIPFWTPDGKLLSAAETKALKAEIRSTELCWMNQHKSRPLVFILDVGSRLPAGASGVKVGIELPDGQVTVGGTYYNRAAGKQTPQRTFALSAATQFLSDAEFQWRQSTTVHLKFPLESPLLLDTRREVPDKPMDIAEGVRWSVEPDAGYDPDQPEPVTRFPAGVLETIDDGSLDLTNYFVRIYKKGSERSLATLVIQVRERDGATYSAEVSDRFPEADQLDRIEFYRQRFTRAQIPNVRIRTDLLPQPTE